MRLLVSLISVLILSGFSTASAQEEATQFNVRQTIVGTDTTPPTTPTLLSADPISANQIDLAWTASTDDFTLWGYVVFRDSSPVATTTLTSYSDTGLAAFTTYSYFIQAFDAASNYSTSSNSLSTSTLEAPPIVATSSSAGEGTVARVVAEEVVVTPDITTANFDITATFPSGFEIRWGRTTDYELGYVSSDILRRNYSTVLTELEPGTTYEYQIIGYTQSGNSNVIESGEFRTLDDIDLTLPTNVSRFEAVADVGDVNLSWELPTDNDFVYVRVVRSHLGYPTNPNDGAIVYQGLGNSAVDVGVLFNYSPAYYTAFVYDKAGNVSSGAIAIAYAERRVSDYSSDKNNEVVFVENDERVADDEVTEIASTNERMPDAFDILIKQNSQEFSFADQEVRLDRGKPFVIYLEANQVTRNLKSIIVRLSDPTDQRKSFSFLLRLNKDQTAYEAILAPLGVVGESSLVLTIYDFRSLRVAEYRTKVLFEKVTTEPGDMELQARESALLWQFLLSVIILGALFVWWLIAKKRGEDKEDDTDG